MRNIYFTSELYLGRTQSIEERGFMDNLDMRENIISNWNETVGENDRVFVLGGISWLPTELGIFNELNGSIVIIPGPYDGLLKDESGLGMIGNKKVSVGTMIDIERVQVELGKEGRKRVDILLSHFPLKQHEHKLHFYGKAPSKESAVEMNSNDATGEICVSYDIWKKPISLDRIVNLFDLENNI